jgi:hypothetical protein
MESPRIAATDVGSAIAAWLVELGAALPAGALDEVGEDERAVLLDLARIAAHRSHRSAAPITTYVVGVAFAGLPREDRLARMRALVERLDDET